MRRVLTWIGWLLRRVAWIARLRNAWLRRVSTWVLRGSTSRAWVSGSNLIARGLLGIGSWLRWVLLTRVRLLRVWVLRRIAWLLRISGGRVTTRGMTSWRITRRWVSRRRLPSRWVTRRWISCLRIS